jgi:hypothetical protein
MNSERPNSCSSWFYLGLFLLCMSVLMLQIVETRILSVVTYYYLAFLTIGMAMFGMTVGALIVYFRQDHFSRERFTDLLTWSATSYAISLVLCFLLQMGSAVSIRPMATTVILWLTLLLLMALPFVFAGMAVSFALTHSPFKVALVYGVDLSGAASGCLVVLFLLNTVDGPSAMLSVAALAAAGGFCFSRAGWPRTTREGSRRYWRLVERPGTLAVVILVIAALNATTKFGVRPVIVKDRLESPLQFAFEKWNSFSRIVAYRSSQELPFLWSASPTLERNRTVESRWVNIDGFAATVMPKFDGDLQSVSYLAYDVTNLAYYIRTSGKAAILGVGSGRDLLSAYLFGFRDIAGVELNPIFVDLLQSPNRLRDYAGVAKLPGVHLTVDEGRSWFARTNERFDLIQMSMIDTFASTGAGAFSLSENGLYTIEAWKIFLSALAPSGVFTVSRWHSAQNPAEIGRVVSLAMAALFSQGVENPRSHIFLVSNGPLATIVVGRDPLSTADVQGLKDASTKLQYAILMSPEAAIEIPVFKDLGAAQGLGDLAARAQRYPLDLSAPTDAHPFFFNQLRISHPEDVMVMVRQFQRSGSFNSGASLVVAGNLLAIGTLLLLIFLSAILVVFVVVIPARTSIRSANRELVWSGTLYFLLIGIGFMLAEIGLIQRISVFIGHPVYGLSVVLFSIILSTGMGSFLSERFAPETKVHFMIWLGSLGAYLFALPFWLPILTNAVESSTLLARAVVSVSVILPAGVLMGFGFPTGMRLVARQDPRPMPWFWGTNGAAGVLASGLGVLSSITFSINTTTQLAGLCYLLLCPVGFLLLAQDKKDKHFQIMTQTAK